MDLTEFLRARIDEDEATARAAAEHNMAPWEWLNYSEPKYHDGEIQDENGFVVVHVEDQTPRPATAEHIARWDPARVLAEVEAKRRIVLMAEYTHRESDDYPGWEGAAFHLAQPYADHPDFDPAWRLDVTPASPR